MNTDIFIPLKEVKKRTSLSGTSIWRRIKDGDFPPGVKISANRVAWPESTIQKWIADKMGSVK